jgi:glutathione S-transferase
MTKPTLYHFPTSRSSRIHWLINEFESKGLENVFETKYLDLSKGETKTEEFLKINPLGTVPVFVDEDDESIIESGAIILHLCEKYSNEVNFIPKNKNKYYQWIMFSVSTCNYLKTNISGSTS